MAVKEEEDGEDNPTQQQLTEATPISEDDTHPRDEVIPAPAQLPDTLDDDLFKLIGKEPEPGQADIAETPIDGEPGEANIDDAPIEGEPGDMNIEKTPIGEPGYANIEETPLAETAIECEPGA